MRDRITDFFKSGWIKFDHDDALESWIDRISCLARSTVDDPTHAHWLRCGGTWFAGVNVLPNDVYGNLRDSGPLNCESLSFVRDSLGITDVLLDKAQLSLIYPGYPKPMPAESEAAFRYRRDNDAAHVDGLLKRGEAHRRYLGEHHRFILGIPLSPQTGGTSPLVVWEGSHEQVRTAFRNRFGGIPASEWGELDITDTYHSCRKDIFDTCRRVKITAQPGESYLVHRLALHGMAPWRESSGDHGTGRMVCYFRPTSNDPENWLNSP